MLTLLNISLLVAGGPQADLYQMNLQIETVMVPDSRYGYIEVRYDGAAEKRFFNARIDGQWVVMNIPLWNSRGIGQECVEGVFVPLPNESGQNLPQASFGWSITDNPLQAPINNEQPTNVLDRQLEQYMGHHDVQPDIRPPQTVKFGMNVIMANVPPIQGGMENPPQGVGECAPQSVLNATKWLKDKNPNMPIPQNLLTLQGWKTVLQWGPGIWGHNMAHSDRWPSFKENFLKANGIPIKTRKLPTSEWGKITDILKDTKCVIELNVPGHVVNVVGMEQNGNTISLCIQQDHEQGPGKPGEVTETISFDIHKRVISGGGPMMNGKKVGEFVVECYRPNEDTDGSDCSGCGPSL